MLEALKFAVSHGGNVGGDRGVHKGLIRRGLACWEDPQEQRCKITPAGFGLIATQYNVLKAALVDNRTIARGG